MDKNFVRTEVNLVLRARALNGERPGWHPERKRLFWVDIREPASHAYDPQSGEDKAWEMPAWIGCHALAFGGAIVALRTGLHDVDIATGALTFLATTPFDSRRFIFDDGRRDRLGRFYAGPMYLPLHPGDQSDREKAAPLWRYEPGGQWIAVLPPAKTSNGLAWSPDGRTMYHSDTGRQAGAPRTDAAQISDHARLRRSRSESPFHHFGGRAPQPLG